MTIDGDMIAQRTVRTLNPMEFTILEQRVLSWIASHASDDIIKAQVEMAIPTARKHTGAGSYTRLETDSAIKSISEGFLGRNGQGPIYGPDVITPDLGLAACTHVFVENGRIACLEIAAYGSSFPETLEEFSLADDEEANQLAKQPRKS